MWFEAMLLPISLIVLAAGGNPARFSAVSFIIFYTLVFSLPALLFLLGAYYMGLVYYLAGVS